MVRAVGRAVGRGGGEGRGGGGSGGEMLLSRIAEAGRCGPCRASSLLISPSLSSATLRERFWGPMTVWAPMT